MKNKKRVVFVGFTKIKYMPYMHFYLDMFNKDEIEIHLIYWNRDKSYDQILDDSIKTHSFEKEMEDTIPLHKKIPAILGFGHFAKKEISIIKPDYLIVMHSTTAITIYSYLVHKYRGKYIFDFRDITYERFSFYRALVGNVVKNSVITFTSSDDFRAYLPNMKEKILTSHNILKSSLKKAHNYTHRHKHEKGNVIRIAFWGLIRHTEYNRLIIKKLGNDKRFELHYYGRATGDDFVLLNNSVKKYKNIYFHGEYMPEERDEFALKTDLIHNLYSNQDETTPHAMGNKFYDGLIYRIPQLCSTDSYMGKLCTSYGVGYECNPNDSDFEDNIEEYYNELDCDKFHKSCDKLLSEIISEVEKGEHRINEFIYEKE